MWDITKPLDVDRIDLECIYQNMNIYLEYISGSLWGNFHTPNTLKQTRNNPVTPRNIPKFPQNIPATISFESTSTALV